MLSPALITALEELRLQEANLVEGEVGLLSHEFSSTLKKHIKDVISFAHLNWSKLSFAVPPDLGHALIMLNRYVGFYFDVPELKNELKPPKEQLLENLDRLLLMIIARLLDEEIAPQIKADPQLHKCFADLCLLHAYFAHEFLAQRCLAIPQMNEEERLLVNKAILIARQSFKRIDTSPITYANPVIAQEMAVLKQKLLHKLYVLECLYHPNAFGFKEMQFHLNRKNTLSRERQSGYHGELIFNPNAFTQHQIDQQVLQALIEKIERIKNKQQPRTQFIVDILGIGHAMVLDVVYDSIKDQVQIINVEPACMSFQATFLKQLIAGLKNRKINPATIAIQTGLLKDYHSCYTFSYALSSVVSQLSFATLLEAKEIPQPDFLHIGERITTDKVANVAWRDVSALGKKAVMMGQSFSEMKENLLKLFPGKLQEVEGMIKDLKQSYGMGKILRYSIQTEAHEGSYIHLKRHSLRQKTKADPYADITVASVLERMNVKTPGMALRRLASGFGRSRDLVFLSKIHPEVLDEQSEKTGKTALHFAYDKGKLNRAYHLEKAGASLTIEDKDLKKPRDLRKKSQ